jgi:hypothetical protein
MNGMTREEAREAWVQALESGKYPQTRNHLKDDNGYCCLGVLCEVLAVPNVREDDGAYIFNNEARAVLPPEVGDFIGMEVSGGSMMDIRSSSLPLAALNDRGVTFKEIARTLREHPDWYFTKFERLL